MVADILTRMDKANEGGIMARISEKNQSLADTIRALMFVFDDLIKVDDRGLQELMKEISKEDLPVALARCQSRNQGEILQEYVESCRGNVEGRYGGERAGEGVRCRESPAEYFESLPQA